MDQAKADTAEAMSNAANGEDLEDNLGGAVLPWQGGC